MLNTPADYRLDGETLEDTITRIQELRDGDLVEYKEVALPTSSLNGAPAECCLFFLLEVRALFVALYTRYTISFTASLSIYIQN